MTISPEIKLLQEKKLVGIRLEMSLVNDRTFELWSKFRPRLDEIEGRVTGDFISLQSYGPNYFSTFDPQALFTKWALVEVDRYGIIPEGMQSFDLKGGRYAVFHYRGSSADKSIFQYIFTEWLPSSGFQLDDRPHFEVLGSRYKNNDPNSEEDIWIPIQ
ncbi:GyrI-like domain-containing protein [Flagellimonas flava]|uniref:AraC family transcriptional regulator n=1 Tax=Flagellimonas flava TaxID=570519 RepID=A0A1M5KQU4_9FLAO|nr:GyrI-like domain-containing protein [Allomuricauda flava]SHG55174.1 AraC family transcriptional regulator [Allomuricauda flava]